MVNVNLVAFFLFLMAMLAFLGIATLRHPVHAQAPQAASPYPRPRFEYIYSEDRGHGWRFAIWHDRETGMEFICDIGAKADSCFPTGRSWLP